MQDSTFDLKEFSFGNATYHKICENLTVVKSTLPENSILLYNDHKNTLTMNHIVRKEQL